MYLQFIKSVKHNAVNRSTLKKSQHIGFGVFIVHSSMVYMIFHGQVGPKQVCDGRRLYPGGQFTAPGADRRTGGKGYHARFEEEYSTGLLCDSPFFKDGRVMSQGAALQRKSHLCIPVLGIARPQPQFTHSCVCERKPIMGIYKSLSSS